MTQPFASLELHRRLLVTPKGRVSLVDVGAGPAALLVHGAGTNAYLWRHVVTALAGAHRRCIAVDLPLHGDSPATEDQPFGIAAFAELLDAVCAELGLGEVDLVANDTGGAVAQVLAATSPGRVRTLTLTNCEAHDNVPPPAFKPTVRLARAGLLRRIAPALLRRPELARRIVFGTGYEAIERLPLQVARSFLEPVIGTPERARQFERWLTSLHARDLLAAEPALRRMPAPTLIVWGTGDRFFHVKWAHWLARTLPNVTELVELAGARLFFPDERAGELVTQLEQHWSAPPQAPRTPTSMEAA